MLQRYLRTLHLRKYTIFRQTYHICIDKIRYPVMANSQAYTQSPFQVLYALGFKTFREVQLDQLKAVDIQGCETGYWRHLL